MTTPGRAMYVQFTSCDYDDNTYVRKKKNINDKLFQNINWYRKKIKLTLEENPKKFLDTRVITKNDTILTQVFTKLTKFPFHWSSRTLSNYKRNIITDELHRAKTIAKGDFIKKLRRIKK